MIDTKKAREIHKQELLDMMRHYDAGIFSKSSPAHALLADGDAMADEIDRLRAALRECRGVLASNDGTSFCDDDVVSAIAAADELLGDPK